MKKKRLVLSLSIGVIAVSSLAAFGFSYAGFAATDNANQTVSSQGKALTSIFLSPTMWAVDGAVYVMHVWKNGGDANEDLTCELVNVAGYSVFLLDTVRYDRFNFLRKNPNDLSVNWNRTADITYDSSKNLYTITAWGGGDTISSYSASLYAPV